MAQFFTDSQSSAPILPPRARRSTSILHWKNPPPSPPVELEIGSSDFSDSLVHEFFDQAKYRDNTCCATADIHNDQSLIHTDFRRDVATSTADVDFMPRTSSSSSTVVLEMRKDGNRDHCAQNDYHRSDSLTVSFQTNHSALDDINAYAPQTVAVADCNISIQSDIYPAVQSQSLTGVDCTVTDVGGNDLSMSSYDSHHSPTWTDADSGRTQNMGLWKQFDKTAWQNEQEKLKQLSLDFPDESDTTDEELPDLSSSNMLSAAALRLYDSFYSGHPAHSTHRVPPARSLSSVWMRDQNRHAAPNADQPVSSVPAHTSEHRPCPAIHRAMEADRRTWGGNSCSHNTLEPDAGNSQSSTSSCLPHSQLAQSEPAAEKSVVIEEKCNYVGRTPGGTPETFIPTDDVHIRSAAENSRQLDFSQRETYGTNSSYVDNYRWQTSATPTHVLQSAVSQTAVEDPVLTRRPSIKELKSRFETERSRDAFVREAAVLPLSSSAASHRHQNKAISALKIGRRSFHGSTGRESVETYRQKPNIDTRHANVSASVSSRRDGSSKKSVPKGRFVTRASIASNAVVNLPILSNDANIDQAERRQFERLVDRRRVFEAADTQPVA